MTLHTNGKSDHVLMPRIKGQIVPALDTGADHYLGVLYICNDFRIAVSPGGRAYLGQFRDADGRWNGRAYIDKSPLVGLVRSDQEAAAVVADLPDRPESHFLAANINALLRYVRWASIPAGQVSA